MTTKEMNKQISMWEGKLWVVILLHFLPFGWLLSLIYISSKIKKIWVKDYILDEEIVEETE